MQFQLSLTCFFSTWNVQIKSKQEKKNTKKKTWAYIRVCVCVFVCVLCAKQKVNLTQEVFLDTVIWPCDLYVIWAFISFWGARICMYVFLILRSHYTFKDSVFAFKKKGEKTHHVFFFVFVFVFFWLKWHKKMAQKNKKIKINATQYNILI